MCSKPIDDRPVHGTTTYRCNDTRDCIIQFCPPDDEHMCSKHVEVWNKLIIKCSASSCLILINKYMEMYGQQNIKFRLSTFVRKQKATRFYCNLMTQAVSSSEKLTSITLQNNYETSHINLMFNSFRMISNLFSQTQHIYIQLIHSWQYVLVLVSHLQANS
jgi:hypothetical protein